MSKQRFSRRIISVTIASLLMGLPLFGCKDKTNSPAQNPGPSDQTEPGETYTYRAPESDKDKRFDYDIALLKLALEKTRSSHGGFHFQPSPVMNFKRAHLEVLKNKRPNFFIKDSYNEKFTKTMKMDFVRFPVDLGIVGYRVCFLPKNLKARVAGMKTLDELKILTHGQGSGWSDIKILRHNGFRVIEASDYEGLFQMLAARRFALFCRGPNELLEEYNAHKTLQNLSYDTTFAIAYPLPRFFYTHNTNQKAIKRVTQGLKIAYRDGSLQKLWFKHYKKSIDFVKLKNRRIFWIENPEVKNLKFNYKKYFYNPMK